MFKGKRFTPAMIVAMIALAVALSGTAVAGTAKLITGSQIANGTIKLADLHPSAKASLKGKAGATGAQGPVGAQGAQGPAGRRAPPARRATRAQGRRRPQGRKGDKGDKGDNGKDAPSTTVSHCARTSAATCATTPSGEVTRPSWLAGR